MKTTPEVLLEAEQSFYARIGDKDCTAQVRKNFHPLLRRALALGQCVMVRQVKRGVDIALDVVQLPPQNS